MAGEQLTVTIDRSFLETLSKPQLEILRRDAGQVIKNKFDHTHKHDVLYGNLPRCMDERQIRLFFSVIENRNHWVAFAIQLFLGLRESELETLEILIDQDLVRIHNRKQGRFEYLPLFEPLRSILQEGFVRYRPAVLRNIFQRYRNIIPELCFVYAVDKLGHQRFQFSNHSLRHSAINRFRTYKKDLYAVRQFSRHKGRDIGIVSTYFHYSLDDMRRDLEQCFKGLELLPKKLNTLPKEKYMV